MRLLKFVYRGLMTGMPLLVYNPYSRVNFHSPFTISPGSLYINYKLDVEQVNQLNKYVKTKTNNFDLMPISMEKAYDEKLDYYISLNIYNCSSPVFLNKDQITRFEINTYVQDDENKGTLIVDYMSNGLSMDPVNIFKNKDILFYDGNTIYGKNRNESIFINASINMDYTNTIFHVSDDLSEYSDYIYYRNGIYDKLFYDTSLTNAQTFSPSIDYLEFRFLNLTFKEPDSIFYFKDNINFVGSMWDNLRI